VRHKVQCLRQHDHWFTVSRSVGTEISLAVATVSTVAIAPANFEDISIDPDGNFYLPSKPAGHIIFRVTPAGVLTTIASESNGFPLGGSVLDYYVTEHDDEVPRTRGLHRRAQFLIRGG
jgi:hypothetical protein